MGRSRSPLESAVYAFIALWLFARLAGGLFTLSAANGHGASALAVWAGASTAVTYALIGVELLILVLLVATERYWLAAAVALLMGLGFIYQSAPPAPAAIARHRRPVPATSGAPASRAALDAARVVITFFAHVEDVRKGGLSAARLACEEMAPAARAQIARALAGRAGGLGGCEAAVGTAARRAAFDRSRGGGYASPNAEYDQPAIARAIIVSADQRTGVYLATDGVRIAVKRNPAGPPTPSWLVTRVEGGPFARR
jgi:hypothetical protein